MKKIFVLPVLGILALASCEKTASNFEGLQSSSDNNKIAQLKRNEYLTYDVPLLTYAFYKSDQEITYTGEFKDSEELNLSYFTFSGSLKGLSSSKVTYIDEHSLTLSVEGTITDKNAIEGYIIVSIKAFKKVPDKYKNITSYLCKVKIGDTSEEVDRY